MCDLRRLMGELRCVRLSLKTSELNISVSYEGSRLDNEGIFMNHVTLIEMQFHSIKCKWNRIPINLILHHLTPSNSNRKEKDNQMK